MKHPLGPELLRALAPPTALPLEPSLVAQLRRAIGTAPRAPGPPLPTLAALEGLWGLLYAQLRTLRRANLDDRAFLHELWDERRAAGRRCAKHLFDIWLSLHHPPRNIVEIGCRTGLSLVNKLFAHPAAADVLVVAFDKWCEWGSPGVVLRNLDHLGIDGRRVFFFNGDAGQLLPAFTAALPEARGAFDYVLVDGSHAKPDARADLVNALPLVAPGGYLVMDDTGPADDGSPGCDLITVFDEVMASHPDFERRHYDAAYGFAVARRR